MVDNVELLDAMPFVRRHRQAVLITQRASGRPQSSNVVYAVDGTDTIYVSVTESRSKTTNARRTPQVSMHISRADFWAYVVLDCDVQLLPTAASPNDPTVNALVEYYRELNGEHPDWDEYRQAMIDERRLLLRLTPTHAYGLLDR
ncbi:MAG: PPOX class F420-dependent oxidoreductase [Actinomycetota bacterium]